MKLQNYKKWRRNDQQLHVKTHSLPLQACTCTLLWGVLLRKFSIVIAFFASAWQILNSLSEIISVFFCNPDFQTQLNAHKNRVINKPFHSSFGQNGPFNCYPLESEQLYVIKKIKEMIIKKIK